MQREGRQQTPRRCALEHEALDQFRPGKRQVHGYHATKACAYNVGASPARTQDHLGRVLGVVSHRVFDIWLGSLTGAPLVIVQHIEVVIKRRQVRPSHPEIAT